MIVIIDNYDSFTYNIVQTLATAPPSAPAGWQAPEIRVFRNDAITVETIAAMQPDRLLISPGPCTPKEAGISMAAILHFAGRIPVLGVCLGHQSIGAALGGDIVRAPVQMHGKASRITTDRHGVFEGLPEAFDVIRYHSLVIARETLPAALDVTATAEDGQIMGVRHRELAGGPAPLEGVQFHPESILSEHGHAMLRNFLVQSGGVKG